MHQGFAYSYITYMNMESMTKFWAIFIDWMYRKECYLSTEASLEFLNCISFTYFVCVMEASVEVRGQLEGVGFLLVHPVSHSPTFLLRSSNAYRVSISSSFKFFSLTHLVLLNPKKGKRHWLPLSGTPPNDTQLQKAVLVPIWPAYGSQLLCLRLSFVCLFFPTLDIMEVLETARSSCQLLSSPSYWVTSQLPKI